MGAGVLGVTVIAADCGRSAAGALAGAAALLTGVAATGTADGLAAARSTLKRAAFSCAFWRKSASAFNALALVSASTANSRSRTTACLLYTSRCV